MTQPSLLVALSLLTITALSFFHFPGHTILESDSQIYLPILEHIWDPSVLGSDPMASHPHVTYTMYDEVLFVLRRVTGAPFEPLLLTEHFLFRAIGVFGLYLLALGVGLSRASAVFVAAVTSLGANVAGPMVLTVEYEPVPRSFAMPFLLLSMGLLAHSRWMLASTAAMVALLFHPPTAIAYCGLFAGACVWKRQYHALFPLAAGSLLFLALVLIPHRTPEGQEIFVQIDPALEKMQRLRANYNWVSVWWDQWIAQYCVLAAMGVVAAWRLRDVLPAELRVISLSLIVAGIASFPVSYLFLERAKWMLMPQFQPGRYLVFVTLFAVLLGAMAAATEAKRGRWWAAALLLLVPFAVPVQAKLFATLLPQSTIGLERALVCVGFAALSGFVLALRSPVQRASAMAGLVLMVFLAFPTATGAQAAGRRDDAAINNLAAWAKSNTSKDAVFYFPLSGKSLAPGVFRARSLRPVYVDWKGGGQVNFVRAFAMVWWDRWQLAQRAKNPEDFGKLGIKYLVYPKGGAPFDAPKLFENSGYEVIEASTPGD